MRIGSITRWESFMIQDYSGANPKQSNKMKTTIATLKAALPEGSHVEEDTHEYGGTISIYAPDWQAWADLGTNSACAEYYDYAEWNATRADAIRFLLEVPSGGLVEASADTIYAMGW